MQSMLNHISLSSATIGEHTRHVIEMFQCLLNNYESGVVNYDERARDIVLQTDTNFIYSNFKYSGFTRKGKQKMELQQIINDKEILLTVLL
jgi:hypothetical protein